MNKDKISHRVIAQQNRRSPSKSNCWITPFHDESVPATSKYSSIHVKQITGYHDLTMECFQCAIFVNRFRAIWKKQKKNTCQQFRFFINLTNKIIFQRKIQKTGGYNLRQRSPAVDAMINILNLHIGTEIAWKIIRDTKKNGTPLSARFIGIWFIISINILIIIKLIIIMNIFISIKIRVIHKL